MGSINKIKILQCNIDKSRLSLHEFSQYFMTNNYSVALVSEPYIGKTKELKSIRGLNIIQFPNNNEVKACIIAKPELGPILGVSQYSSPNLSVALLNIGGRKLYIASVYVEPNEDNNNTLELLDTFLHDTRNSHQIVGGDLNGWHQLWGCDRTNARGKAVAEIAHANNMFFCNTGNTPTFETVTHGRVRSSIIDVTFTSSSIRDRVHEWRVNNEACTTSQHNAVEFILRADNHRANNQANQSTFLYKSDKACWNIFKNTLHLHIANSDLLYHNIVQMEPLQLEDLIGKVTEVIHAACRASMPIRKGGSSGSPPWWSENLEQLKSEVIDLHHKIHRAKIRNEPLESLLQEREVKKATYAKELRTESTRNFREFCQLQTKENVWSLTNRLLKESTPRRPPSTIKIGNTYTTDGEETARALLNHFYPDDTPDSSVRHHQLRSDSNIMPENECDPPFTTDEVLEQLNSMNPKKAPGMDNLPADVCSAFASAYPQLLTDIMNRCLSLQYFPTIWKKAYVKIIPKPNKPDYSALNSFRPIGLLNVFSKLLEKLFIKRITYKAAKLGLLNSRQFGFKEQTNTTAALDNALRVVRDAKLNKELVLAVSLDIKAAFDNAWWPALFHRLQHLQCPKNILGLIHSYFKNREVTLDHAGARITKTMSKGCIQGSACGPLMWNIILDELLDVQLPPGCHLQAFADDVLLIATAKQVSKLQDLTNNVLKTIVEWGNSVKLTFGPLKTQLIAFTPKAKLATIAMDGHQLEFVPEIKLLGVIIDEKLSFNSHVRYVIGKATRTFNKLCMYTRPTWGAHPENIRTIYLHVIEPTITYAAGIWGHTVRKKCIRKLLESMQRGFALRAIRSFRTVSTSAALALAQFIPLDLRVLEVHSMECTRLSGNTQYLPSDVPLERPTPYHELLHPSSRVSITFEDATTAEEVGRLCTPETVQVYTDGSKQENGSVGAAFVCYKNGKTLTTKKFKMHNSCSVFQAELFAILEATRWALNNQKSDVLVLSDSMSSLQALKNRSSTHPLVAQIHGIIKQLQNTGIVRFAWVKSHIGIPGNEAADQAAKKGAELPRTPAYFQFPLSYTKHKNRSNTLRIWQSRYESASQGQHTRKLLPNITDIKDLWKTTKITFNLTQILTGHAYNKAYLHRFKILADDRCPCDDNATQSIEHLMKECPRFDAQRQKHEFKCEMLKVSPYKITEVMQKESSLNTYLELCDYIITHLKSFNNSD